MKYVNHHICCYALVKKKKKICSLTTMNKIFLRLQLIHIGHRLDDTISSLGSGIILTMIITVIISFTCCSVKLFFFMY